MKVKAKRMGYYNHKRRSEGSVFHLKDEKEFSKNWMVEIKFEEVKPKKKSTKANKNEEVVDLNEEVI